MYCRLPRLVRSLDSQHSLPQGLAIRETSASSPLSPAAIHDHKCEAVCSHHLRFRADTMAASISKREPPTLLTIPPEIRLMIYRCIFPDFTINIFPPSYTEYLPARSSSTKMLFTCRSIFEELLPLMIKDFWFHYSGFVDTNLRSIPVNVKKLHVHFWDKHFELPRFTSLEDLVISIDGYNVSWVWMRFPNLCGNIVEVLQQDDKEDRQRKISEIINEEDIHEVIRGDPLFRTHNFHWRHSLDKRKCVPQVKYHMNLFWDWTPFRQLFERDDDLHHQLRITYCSDGDDPDKIEFHDPSPSKLLKL